MDTRSAPPLPPSQTPINDKATIRSAVDLVEVDVEVTDRDGKPIKGLRQDQFSVAEDGKEQKISTFDYYDVEEIEKGPTARYRAGDRFHRRRRRARATAPDGSRPPPDRAFLRSDLPAAAGPHALDNAAKKFLHDQMTAADLVGVVAFGNQLHVVSDFTNDRDQLNSAVDAAASRQGIATRRAGRRRCHRRGNRRHRGHRRGLHRR